MENTTEFTPDRKVNTIITSPPYMKKLDYARDNRLRLWFLGVIDWKSLDKNISLSEKNFITFIRSCLKLWNQILVPKGLCVLVLGDANVRSYNMSLPEVISHIAINEICGYSLFWTYTEKIPDNRRVRRNNIGCHKETILVLRNEMG